MEHAMHHSTSKMAELQGRVDTQEVTEQHTVLTFIAVVTKLGAKNGQKIKYYGTKKTHFYHSFPLLMRVCVLCVC